MKTLLLGLALGASALSNFPREAGGRVSQPAIAVTVGGAPAVVLPAGDLLTGFRPDGETPSGLPVSLAPDDAAAGGAAAADMDGDGRPELAVATPSGRVFLWSGGVLPGFPVSLGVKLRSQRPASAAGVSFGDVDGDGRPELLVGDEKGRLHALERNGAATRGFPIQACRAAVTSPISVSIFAGERTLAAGCEDGRVAVVSPSGEARPGFPLVTSFAVTGAPVFADLDDDGEMDLLVASQDYRLHAVSGAGAALPGFPVAAGYRLYEGPAVADLDGDRRLDVVFAAADGKVHAVDRTGAALPGFPVQAGGRIFGGPVVGDLDRDGVLDVVVVSADATAWAFSAGGRALPGFPAPLGTGDVHSTPLLLDLAGDGTLSAFVGLPAGDVHAVRAQAVGTAVAAAPWPAPGRDAARSGRSGPNAPTYRDLVIEPPAPRVTDALRAAWQGRWLDAAPGEAVPAPRIAWRRNGQPVPALDGKREVPAGTARRGEGWQFVLAPPAGGESHEGPEVRIQDSAPGAPALALDPAEPSRSGPVRAVIARPAPDPDGDALEYRVEWLLDGLDTGLVGTSFPGERLRKGALLTARAVASDGEREGPAAVVQARVGDTAPGAPVVALDPALPRRLDPLRARIGQPAADVDGDRLEYRYRWTVDGAPLNLPLSAAELAPASARKRQKVAVEVRAFDGQKEGPPASAEVAVRNTPPTAPRVAILPARPRRGEPLRAVFTVAASDADDDRLSYRFTWRKNGGPVDASEDGREIAGGLVEKGDRFEVTVIANDGEADGPQAFAAVTIGNTRPTPPRIAIEPGHPRGGEPLRAVVAEPARDADGEVVTLQYAWTRDGKPTGSNADTLPPALFRKHERVRVVVTPRDTEDAGDPAVDEVKVANAPPGAAAVELSPAQPVVTKPLAAVVRTPARDPDGDAVKYRYRWLRDGVPVVLADGTEGSRRAPFWTAAAEVPAKELGKGQRWEVEVQAGDGEAFGASARATATVVNSPPSPPRLAFAPARPRRVDGLSLALEQPPDPDGDAVTYRFAWSRNGARVDGPPEQAHIPRNVARRGERWAVEVIASDGEADAPATRLETTIADTAPGPAAVTLCDGPVPVGTPLAARITSASSDADGDAVSYRYEWTVGGKPVPAASGLAKLAGPSPRKHDVVRVVLTPHDGELAGPAAAAECTIVNTPPTAPAVAIEPAAPAARTGAQVIVRKTSQDRDGDAVTYRIAWSRNGVPAAYEGAIVPSAVMRHGETWRAEVTPFDGEETGEPVQVQALVRNTAPGAPSVLIRPEEPAVGRALLCDAQAPQRDVDGEPLTTLYRWFRNDRPDPLAEGGATLPASVIRRGETWRCEAWLTDGTAESPRASAAVTVRNSPPSAPQVVVEPERPRRTDDLVCRISVPAVDPDGDAITYAYAWWRNERPMPPGADPSRVEASRIGKGEKWRCAATPTDGAAAGAPGQADRAVANTPPGPARVRLLPAAPRAGQPIRCEVSGRSEDADADAVRYRFSWQRNGVAQPFAETSEEVPARLVRAGDRWRCEVTPTDGSEDGPVAGSEEVPVAGEVGRSAR